MNLLIPLVSRSLPCGHASVKVVTARHEISEYPKMKMMHGKEWPQLGPGILQYANWLPYGAQFIPGA